MTTVEEVVTKAMTFDYVLENTDPAILIHRQIPISQLSDSDLEDIYQYKYPQNVKWLIEVRHDFIEKKHPEELI